MLAISNFKSLPLSSDSTYSSNRLPFKGLAIVLLTNKTRNVDVSQSPRSIENQKPRKFCASLRTMLHVLRH